nr:hypothetical protein [uncultured Pseudomonas sp.]
MGTTALEKPVAPPVQKVAPDPASQHVQGGLEPLNFIAPGNFVQPSSIDTSGLEESVWQPMIEALLLQAGKSFLDWVWQALKEYFAEPLALLNGFQQLTTVLLDPLITVLVKSKALLDFLEAQPSLKPAITPYIAIAQRLHHIIEVQQQRAAVTLAHSVLTLKSLVALAYMPEVQALAGKHTLAPVQNLLRGALEMGQTWLQLSQTSWDSPESVLEGLRKADVLPGWVIEIVEQGQRLYEALDALYVQAESQAEIESAPPLKRFLTQFNESNDALGKFTALFYLLVDDTALPALNKYAGDAFGGLFKVFALLKNGHQVAAPEDTSGLSAALLTLDHYTSKPFIARMSGAGQVGQMMAEPLSLAHAALRGSAKQEAGMNMVLRLFDPKQTWTRFAKETIAEVLWLPEKEHVWKLLTSDVFQHGKMIRALSQVLDNQFWEEYQTASWHELPAVIGSTLKRDLQAPDSHFVRAQSIASGVPADLMQPVLTMTASIIASWKGDNWSVFLKASTQSVTDMVKTMASKGQLLPDTLQKVLNACLFLTKNVARLISLWSLWHATHDKQQLGNESVALIRQLLVEHADDTTVWAFDKALVWLPVLPGLYRVLKHLQPIEAGQRIQWVTRLLVSLYSQPEVQANPEIIQLREQVQRIAQEWLGAIPDAVLGKAVIEEVEAQPGPVQKAVIKSLYLAIDAAPPLLRLMKSAVNYASAGLLGDVIRGLLQPQPSLVPLIMFLAVIPESSEAVKEASTPKPEPEPQPIDTTPVLGGVTAVTFMAGMVLAFKARKSYREGQLAAQKQEEEADAVESLVMSPVVQTGATSEQDNLIENTTLPDLPVTKNKANNWKIEAALAGVSLLLFSASAYALFKQHTSSATLTASDAATKIEKLCDTLLVMLAVPQEEIELTADAVDQWLKAFTTEVAALNESLASFDALLTPPPSDETNTSPSPPSLARRKKRDTSSQTQQKLEAVFNVVAVPISQTTAPNLQSRATIESDIKATKIELAGFINELSERTRQTQEPFIENNQNYRSKQQFDKLVKLVPEHLEDYNARISRNATRIRNELTPAINDRTARLKFLVEALAKKPKVHKPVPRQSLFFPYDNITPAVPIEGITTAHALIAYRWDNVNIDTHGKLEGFKVENTLVRALVYCNHLIEEIVKKRDENIATNPMTFTTRDQYNQDMLVFFDTREKILDLIEYQFINNKRIDARSLVRKNQDREEFILGRITEILDNYLPERSLTAQSLFDVEYHLPAMIHTERFTLIQIAKGIHTLSNNARSPSVCVVKWAELDSPPAQTEILALKDEWQIVKQMTRDSDRTSELMNAAQSADLTAYDIRPYSETYIKKIAATQIPVFQNRQGISGSTRVWEKREEYINPDNKKISRRTPQAPRYQSTNLLEILWGITEKKRLSDTVRTQLTYSHSPLFMGTTETGAAKVAKALIYRDFYTHYIGVIENAFKDAETIKLQQELINIKLRSLKAYEFFSSVSLNGRVLPGVVSGFKNLNDHIIYSFPDDKLWKFDTPIAVHNAYKNNTDDFKTFMDSRQFYKNYLANEDNLGMSLTFELFTNPAEEIIKSYQERYTEDADLLTHSKSELQTLKILEQLKFGWCLISVFIGAFTVPSTILGLVFGPLAPLIQSFVADLPDEKNTYLWESAAAGVAELLSSIPNVRGFLDSKVTRKALGLSPLVKNKPIPAAFFTEQGMFKRVPLKLMDKQPLVIPLGTVLQKPGDVDSPAEPVKSFTTVLPGPYKEDQWRKKELWVNHYVFTQFEALKKAGSISLNDDHYQYMTLSFLPDAVSSSRWEFDSMIAPASSTSSGQPSKRKNSKGATMAEVLKDSNEYLTTLLASHPVSYKVSIDGQPDSDSSGDLISDDALSSEGIRFFDQVNYTAPDNNAYCDRLLLALDMPTTILYFTKTLKNNKVNGGENSNALDMLDYLISYDSTARSIVWPSRYNQDFIDTTLSALSSSYIIAELLLEMLMTNIDSHYRVSIAPFSRSAVKTFIQRLAAQAAANIGYQPRYEFPRYYLTGSLFLEELKTLKTQLTSNLATWLVIINYSEGAEPDQATDEVIVLGGSRSAQQGSSSDTANHLGKDVLVHDIDQPGIPLELQPEAVLPLAYADTFVDRTPVIGEITARYLWDKPISVRDGERVRIRVKRHNSRITAKEGIYEVPSGSRGPHAFPHFVAELINREFDNKILFSNTQVRVIAGTRKEVFDTHKKVTGYTYSLEVADRINIYSDINLVSPGNNPYEIIIDFMNEYGLPID